MKIKNYFTKLILKLHYPLVPVEFIDIIDNTVLLNPSYASLVNLSALSLWPRKENMS